MSLENKNQIISFLKITHISATYGTLDNRLKKKYRLANSLLMSGVKMN
jgi:hypothetical protein